jgi:hypothetical protein
MVSAVSSLPTSPFLAVLAQCCGEQAEFEASVEQTVWNFDGVQAAIVVLDVKNEGAFASNVQSSIYAFNTLKCGHQCKIFKQVWIVHHTFRGKSVNSYFK